MFSVSHTYTLRGRPILTCCTFFAICESDTILDQLTRGRSALALPRQSTVSHSCCADRDALWYYVPPDNTQILMQPLLFNVSLPLFCETTCPPYYSSLPWGVLSLKEVGDTWCRPNSFFADSPESFLLHEYLLWAGMFDQFLFREAGFEKSAQDIKISHVWPNLII